MTGTGGNGWESFSFGNEDYRDGLNPISRVACRITLKFKIPSPESLQLCPTWENPASGFILWHDNEYFLVTAWHCVTGRNSFKKNKIEVIDKHGRTPCQVVIDLTHLGIDDLKPRPLFDEEGRPLWLEHPDRDTEIADLVALPLAGLPPGTPALFKPGFAEPHPDMHFDLPVGEDVFVVGFPRAIGNGSWPVWKRASLASEPTQSLRLASKTDRPLRAVLVDGAFMGGLSGSLAIRRSASPAVLEQGMPTQSLWISRDGRPFYYSLVGVYANRAGNPEPVRDSPGEDGKGAEERSPGRLGEEELAKARLGIVWKAELLLEVLRHGVRGRG